MTLVDVRGAHAAGGRSVGEEGFYVGAQGRLVGGLHGEEIVGLHTPDRRCDGGICGDGIDRNQRAFEAIVGGKPLDQDRNGGGFIGLVGDRLLAEHEAMGGREGRDEMERRPVGAAVMASTRGLAGSMRFITMVSHRAPGTP